MTYFQLTYLLISCTENQNTVELKINQDKNCNEVICDLKNGDYFISRDLPCGLTTSKESNQLILKGTPTCNLKSHKYNIEIYNNDMVNSHNITLLITIIGKIYEFHYSVSHILDIPSAGLITLYPVIDCVDVEYTLRQPNDNVYSYSITIDKGTGKLQISYPTVEFDSDFTIEITITAESKYPDSKNYDMSITFSKNEYYKGYKYYIDVVSQKASCPNSFYVSMVVHEGIKQNELDFFTNVDNFIQIFPNLFETFSNFKMNITGYINVKNKDTFTFYSRSNYMSTVSVDDKYMIYNFYEKGANESLCHNYTELLKNSTELDVGYHKFELFVLSNKEDKFPFDFLYSERSGGQPKHIDSYYKSDYMPISNFSVDQTDLVFTVNEIVSIQFSIKNAMSCLSEPELPEGIEIQLDSNQITGKTVKVSKKTSYNFLCTNIYSISNIITLTIEVVDNSALKPGLVSYYLKPITITPSYYNVPHTLEKDKDNLMTKIIRHEEFINNQFNINAKPWLGLSSHFISKYDVEWKGLIYFDTSNSWLVELNCKDACSFYVNSVLIRSITGMNEVNITKTGAFTVREIGYYDFTFHLSVNEGGAGNVIRMQKPKSNSYEYIDNMLFYIPNDKPVQYNYTVVNYNTNVTIEPNVPIIITDKAIREYKVEPNLPDGLTLNKNGTITGKPTKSSLFQTYNITTTFTDNEIVSNQIQIGIEDIHALSSVYLYNNLTNQIIDRNNPPIFPVGVYVELIIKVDYGEPYNYGCSGLPAGLTYHPTTKVIEGYPTKTSSYFLSIFAESIIEKVKTVYTISVEETCKEGYHMVVFDFLFNTAEYQAYLQDIKGNEIFIIYKLSKPIWNYQLCLKEDEYKFILYMNTFAGERVFYYKILVDGNIYYNGNKMVYKADDSTVEWSFSTVTLPPNINYSSNKYTLESFNTVEITPTVTNLPTLFYITPSELINGLSFDSKTGTFKGASISHFEDKKYTIVAENPFGKSEPVTISFKSIESQCEENGKSILHLFVNTTLSRPEFMFIEIKDKNNKVILSVDGSILFISNKNTFEQFSHYEYYTCIAQGDYKLTYGTTHYNKLGWLNGYFEVFLDKIALGHFSMPLEVYEMSEITTNLHFVYDIDINSKWEYRTKEDENDWYLPSSTTKWQETLLNQIPEIKADVVYLRKRITISNIEDYSSYATKLELSSGFKFYMNGNEVFSQLDGIKSKDYYQFLFPIHRIEEGRFMVAIELHRTTSSLSTNITSASAVFPYLRFISFGILGDESECLTLNYFGGNVIDEFPKLKFQTAINAFIIDYERVWKVSRSMVIYNNIYATYSFGYNTFVPINQFYIISGDGERLSYPKNVTIEILLVNNTWIEYVKGNEMNLQEKFESYSIQVLNSDLQINQIKFTLDIGQRLFSVGGLKMVNCQFYTCPKTDYLPETKTNSIVRAKCIDDPEGYRIFQCPFGKNPEWKELENHCQSKPILLSSITKHTFIVGNTEKPVALFSISGKVNNVNAIPNLPDCIISTTIGIYYSNCVYVKEKNDYMFVIENDIGSINVTINIEVIGTNKPVIIESLSSYTFYADLYINIAYLFKIVGSNLEFTVEPELPSGIKLNKNIGYIYGKTSSCFVASTYLFTCTNEYGSVKISVELNCTSNQEPIVVEIKEENNLYANVNYSNYSLFTVAGRNLSYSIQPDLPNSLVLDVKTGYINGEVIIKDEKKRDIISEISNNYTVIVTNENGIDSKNITLFIKRATIPVVISDIKNVKIPENVVINNYKIMEVAGEVTEYSILPDLPNGITFNITTGEISGVPLETVGNKMYTFTLNNSQGSSNISMFLSFNVPESPLIYKQENSLTFYKTIEINSTQLVTATGKDVISYYIYPSLPHGLSFSSSTSKISGTPTVVSELTNYTISIKNKIGEISTNISFEIIIKTCNSEDIWPDTEMGKEHKIKCNGLYSGSKTRVCKRSNNDAIWESANEDCYIPVGYIIMFSLLSLVVVFVGVIVGVYFYYSYQKKKRTVKPSAEETKFSDI